jgi:2-dehydro-3-deoxy-D-arabinonate dehydratase
LKLFRTATGRFVEDDGHQYRIDALSWDALIAHDNLEATLEAIIENEAPTHELQSAPLLAPIEGQEVWAAGVTYYRSRGARMEESKDAGGGDFYDRVYSAERPELFFKSMASRTVGPGGKVRIRKDAHWSVPEPELTLVVSPRGKIIGYTIGNDMSSRDIEGENPLYLPQATVYAGSCARICRASSRLSRNSAYVATCTS